MIDRPNDADLVSDLGHFGHMFANFDATYICFGWFEVTTNAFRSIWLQIPHIDSCRTTRKPNHNYRISLASRAFAINLSSGSVCFQTEQFRQTKTHQTGSSTKPDEIATIESFTIRSIDGSHDLIPSEASMKFWCRFRPS